MASRQVTKRSVLRTLSMGVLVVALYATLFLKESEVLALSARGGWMFVVPLAIAFVFSFAHGVFTGHFWEMFGVRAKGSAGAK